MEQGAGSNAPAPPRSVWYRLRGRGARLRYTPRRGAARSAYRSKHSYPNDLVLTVDDERHELKEAFGAQQAEVTVLRETVADRGARIFALKIEAAREFERAEAFRDQVRRFRVRLARLIEGIRGESPAIRFRVSTLTDMANEIEAAVIVGDK